MSSSSSRRAWPVPVALGLLAAAVVACGPGGGPAADRRSADGQEPAAPPLVGPDPRHVIELPAGSELPLPPRHFVEVGPDLLLAADPHEAVLWRLRVEAAGARLERAHVLSPDPRARVRALSAAGGTIAALDRGGRITLWDPRTWERRGEHSAATATPARFAGMASLPDGSVVLLHREAVPDAARALPLMQHVLRHAAAGASPQVLWTDTPAEVVRASYDQRFLTARERSLVLSGELPPRVLRIPVDSPAAARATALEGVPPRPIPAAERAALEAEIRAAPAELRRQAWVPELYPAVLRAWLEPDGFLAWAAAPGETMLLERYCGAAYRGTVLSRRSWREVAVLPSWIVAVSDVGRAGDMRLELFDRAALEPRCP